MENFETYCQSVKSRIDAEARALGLTEYDVYMTYSSSLSTETLKDEIAAFSSSTKSGVGFRCIVNGQAGYASAQRTEDRDLHDLVCSAAANAAVSENDEKPVIFAGSPSYCETEKPTVKMPSGSEAREAALALQRSLYAADMRMSDGTQSGVCSESFSRFLANSKGLVLSDSLEYALSYAEAILKEGEEAADGFAYAEGWSGQDCVRVRDEAIAKASAKIGAELVPTGAYPVVFEGKAFASLLSAFESVFSARSAQRGLSLLKGREGEIIAAPCVNLIDDPFYPGSAMQTAFDGEGVATSMKTVIDKGKLTTLLYDLATAAKASEEGTPRRSTGNGQRASYASPVSIAPYAFYFEAGKNPLSALLGKASGGVLIRSLKGLHAGVQATSGDFSLECEGFAIEEGKVGKSLRSFTVSGNFFTLLQEVKEFSNEVWFTMPGTTRFGSPDVYFEKLSIAGK